MSGNLFKWLDYCDDIRYYCDEEGRGDAKVKFYSHGETMEMYVTAEKSRVRKIELRWKRKTEHPVYVLGDSWERACGNLSWHPLSGERAMPWYFLATDGSRTLGVGVKTGASSYVCFSCDASGITASVDLRCGGVGVDLSGREILACTFFSKVYYDISQFDAAKEFCRLLCDNPIFPKEPIYGGNNWYYAYGKSSYEEIMADARLIARLAGDNKNRPFMVIDDGWQINPCDGPWLPNEKFGDMKKIASEFKAMGVRPGIWFRPLMNTAVQAEHPDWCLVRGNSRCLDPSHPEVKKLIKEDVERIKSWGFELIKHDFTNFDVNGSYSYDLKGSITNFTGWSFYDNKKTGAEILRELYKLIKETAGDIYIIGCNTSPHLCAGYVEINRVGNDTSGKMWNYNRKNGLNALAFRLCQDNAFYKVDADCVGIFGDNIPWELNRQWLDILSKSGTPLFVAVEPSAMTPQMEKDLKEAFRINSLQEDVAEPLDWMYNTGPQNWMINGQRCEYDFFMDEYPEIK